MTANMNPQLADLIEAFDVFFLDQYGTLHDGRMPYPGAVDALQRIRSAGRRVVILSNSGKSAADNAARFVRLGFPETSFDHFVTSGEVAVDLVETGRLGLSLSPRTRCFTISSDTDTNLADRLGLTAAEKAEEADLIVISGSQADKVGMGAYADMLRHAAAAGVPAICTNPDIQMLTPSGLAPAAGSIARLYESFGGRVAWVGKPHPAMYDYAYRLCGSPPKERIVAIGDSLEHDVAGAHRFGIASVLVRLGVSDKVSREALQAAVDEAGLKPLAILDRLS